MNAGEIIGQNHANWITILYIFEINEAIYQSDIKIKYMTRNIQDKKYMESNACRFGNSLVVIFVNYEIEIRPDGRLPVPGQRFW